MRYFSLRLATSELFVATVVMLVALSWSRPALGNDIAKINAAASDGDLERVQALLKHNPRLALGKDKTGWTPLHAAAEGNHKDIAELLLANGADVNARDDNGKTPLGAANNGVTSFRGMVELLLASGADVNAKDNYGFTPLDRAASSDRCPEDVIELLRQHGGQSAYTPKEPGKAIQKAACEGNAEKAAALVSSADPSSTGSALIDAAKSGYLNVVQAMVANGADVNGGRSAGGETVENLGLFYFLEGCNSVPDNHMNLGAFTPLVAATIAGKFEVVKWLAEHGANLDLQGIACMFKDLREVHGMTAFRAVRARNIGNTALSDAILTGQVAIAQTLVEHGADLSRRVVITSAAIPDLLPIAFETSKRGLVGIGSNGNHLREGGDGLVYTDLKIELQQELTIRELASRSTHPEIRALSAGTDTSSHPPTLHTPAPSTSTQQTYPPAPVPVLRPNEKGYIDCSQVSGTQGDFYLAERPDSTAFNRKTRCGAHVTVTQTYENASTGARWYCVLTDDGQIGWTAEKYLAH